MILLLETATPVCSVVLCEGDKILAQRDSSDAQAHSAKLAVFINEIVAESGKKMQDIEAVCVSSGPGSYTGLRIGVSAAKGLCYALERPLLSVPTLKSMAAQYYMEHPDYNGWVCPMVDARRMECYAAIFNKELEEIKPTTADIIEEGIYDTYLSQNTITFIGNGAAKTQPILGVHNNARWDDFEISAKGMMQLSQLLLNEGKVEDVAYFEPFYLKDFVAKKPVVKGLR